MTYRLPHNSYLNDLVRKKKKPFENSAGKGENANKQHFLIFCKTFSTISKINSIIQIVVCKGFLIWRAKILSCGKQSDIVVSGVILYRTTIFHPRLF